eukprot:2273274-Karenia_brevis.AAC.1
MVYTAAWREKLVVVGCNAKPLQWIREYKDALWWEMFQNFSRAERRNSGEEHRTKGHMTGWEDVLCMIYGVEWRSY